MPEEKKNVENDVLLPAYGDLTREFFKAFEDHFFMKLRSTGVLAEIKAHIIHEGRTSQIQRKDGTVDDVEMSKMGAEFQLTHEEIEKLTFERVVELIDQMAEEGKRQQSERLFQTIDDTVAKTGLTVDAGGQRLNHDLIFEMLNSVQHEFPEGVGSSSLIMVVSPNQEGLIAALENEFNASPELRERHHRIMQEKYDEFRSREMDRNLAG